jgi:hypothetical protein
MIFNFLTWDSNLGKYYNLSRSNEVVNFGSTSGTETYEHVTYMYVDRDVTITAKGKSEQRTDYYGKPYTFTSNNFSLALKAGWNAIYDKTVTFATFSAGQPNNLTNGTVTHTFSLGNPASLKWVLDIY